MNKKLQQMIQDVFAEGKSQNVFIVLIAGKGGTSDAAILANHTSPTMPHLLREAAKHYEERDESNDSKETDLNLS